MRVLITGATGFAGRHLIALLSSQPELELHGTGLEAPDPGDRRVRRHQLDLRDPQAVTRLLLELRPDRIFHLAAQAFVPQSWEDPWGTLENNIRAQLNILEAARRLDAPVRVLVVASNEVYGQIRPEDLPLTEDSPLRPDSPYGVSKVAQDMLGLQVHLSFGLPVVRARPFNHIGPGQDPRFVAPDFARQIAEIEAGLRPPVMYVGNLSAQRDFSDVRDMVRAYDLLLRHGEPGEVYNIGSGTPRSIRDLLDGLLAHSTREIEVCVDPARLRPSDVPVSYCDPSRVRAQTGWMPEIPFEQSLADVLNDARRRLARSDHGYRTRISG